MNFEIMHNGKDIKSLIPVASCYSYDRYGGMLDDLAISFASDSNGVEFNKDDTLEIRTAGGFSTGLMYLDSCNDQNGMFTLRALSFRNKNRKKKSKIWNRVKLSKIITDVAANTGLTPVLYGISDYSYACVSQIMETDLMMLARICKREGYSIKCDNGNLIVFNEYYLESNAAPITIAKNSVGSGCQFERSENGLSSMTVRYFDIDTKQTIAYTSTDSNIAGGESIRIEFLMDINEAHRASRGYLREANKLHVAGILPMDFNGNISAGTVVDLTGFEEFDGRYVVYEAMHDFVLEKTIIKVRKLLGY